MNVCNIKSVKKWWWGFFKWHQCDHEVVRLALRSIIQLIHWFVLTNNRHDQTNDLAETWITPSWLSQEMSPTQFTTIWTIYDVTTPLHIIIWNLMKCLRSLWQMLGALTAIPIKVPHISSLQRLAGHSPSVLPQVVHNTTWTIRQTFLRLHALTFLVDTFKTHQKKYTENPLRTRAAKRAVKQLLVTIEINNWLIH